MKDKISYSGLVDKLYLSITASIGFSVTPEGHWVDANYSPVTVEGRRLTMPSDKRLRSPDWDKLQYFHPLCENANRGESPVIQFLTRAIGFGISDRLKIVMLKMAEVAAYVDGHQHLNAKQHEVTTPLAEADDKFYKLLENIFEACEFRTENTVFSLFLNRNKQVGSESFLRLAAASFPLYNEIINANPDNAVIAGVSVKRKKDLKLLKALFEFAIPEVANGIQVGSNNDYAPYLMSLMELYYRIGNDCINKWVKIYKLGSIAGTIEFGDEYLTAFVKQDDLFIASLAMLRDAYKLLPGNDGEYDKGIERARSAPVADANRLSTSGSSTPTPIKPSGISTLVANNPTTATNQFTKKSGGLSGLDALRANEQPQQNSLGPWGQVSTAPANNVLDIFGNNNNRGNGGFGNSGGGFGNSGNGGFSL